MMIVWPMTVRLMMVVRLSVHPLIQDSLSASTEPWYLATTPEHLGWPACVLLRSYVCPFGEMSHDEYRSPISPL